jgi:hypothetical protein
MSSEQKNPAGMSEHEKKNEGGREFGRVHEPTQAQQASRNQGLADNRTDDSKRQPQQAPGQQQGGSGSRQGAGSQQGKPPGNMPQEQKKEHQGEKKSA